MIAAVCPQAPALIPAVGHGIADELASVREACLAAAGEVIAEADRIAIVGPGPSGEWDESAGGTLRGFGPDVRAGGADVVLSPGLTVGAWLLDEVGWTGPRTYVTGEIPVDADALLVMADGSSRHRRLAPEWSDPEGRAFDAAVAQALADGDTRALAALDVATADEFGASGVAGLIALGERAGGAQQLSARLFWDGAPFDVGYWVARWSWT